MTDSTKLAAVQAAFIAEVEQSGIVHALEWVGGWFNRAAMAAAEDELQHALGEHVKDAEARELLIVGKLMSEGSTTSSYSSGPGANLMKQARVAAHAKMLSDSRATLSATARGERWDVVRARLSASEAAGA
jgi:hypothetical protein